MYCILDKSKVNLLLLAQVYHVLVYASCFLINVLIQVFIEHFI